MSVCVLDVMYMYVCTYVGMYVRMSCNVMQCIVMYCNALQCNALQCNAMECNVM